MIYLAVIIGTSLLLIAVAHKWELEKKIALPWSVLMGALSGLTVYFLSKSSLNLHVVLESVLGVALAIFISMVALLLLFFRNPERTPPKKEGVVLAPADGKIIYVKTIQKGEFPFALKRRKSIPLTEFTDIEFIEDRGIQIGIGMSLMDVHINRSPLSGKFSFIKRIPGKFKSLKRMSSLLENERVVAVIEGEKINIGLVLIASRLVRRICLDIKEDDCAQIGHRIGMIRFGSQADILIPDREKLEIHVKTGDKVKAGESILATY